VSADRAEQRDRKGPQQQRQCALPLVAGASRSLNSRVNGAPEPLRQRRHQHRRQRQLG